jgi:threonine dehydrogenase-like Zn-dependent dehydrogenase
MRAAVFHAAGRPLSIETLDDPTPAAGEVIIKVDRCGICGTDLHMTAGHGWDYAAGTVPGHEYAGEIVAVGSGVEGFRTGELITGLPSSGCGHCAGCAHGIPTLCDTPMPVMGGFGEYLRVPVGSALKLPASLSLADGALVEPLAVGLNGVRVAGLTGGERVLVLGGGAVALCAIFWARQFGAGRIVTVSRSKRRAALCLDMGADAFVQSGTEEIPAVIEQLGGSPDIVLECVGATGMLGQAVFHVRKFGQVVSLGFCTAPDPIIPAIAAWKAIRFAFPVGYSMDDFRYAADHLDAGKADPRMLVSSTITLADLPVTFEALRGPNVETKVQVRM